MPEGSVDDGRNAAPSPRARPRSDGAEARVAGPAAMKRPPFVLAIGGLDPSCGAGIVADARTLERLEVMPLAVATAVTVQSGGGVRATHPVPVPQVTAQLRELLRAFPASAIKIGQVPSAACAAALAATLRPLTARVPLVLDPVLRASGGGELAGPAAARAILARLLPLAAVVTVNLDEAAVLTGMAVRDVDGMSAAARRLSSRTTGAIVIKGGHLRGQPLDMLLHEGCERIFRGTRLRGSMHGTGCAFASAMAAALARGMSVEAALVGARKHVRELLTHAVTAGGARLRAPRRVR